LSNTYAAGDLTAHFQVPFIGCITQGNFFADTQLRFDLYQSTSTSEGNNTFGALNDAKGISVTGAAGYRFALVHRAPLNVCFGLSNTKYGRPIASGRSKIFLRAASL